MKKTVLFFMASVLSVACEKDLVDKGDVYFFRSYVNAYYDGDLDLRAITDSEEYPLGFQYLFQSGKSEFYCSSPEVSRNPTDPERFLEIAERNGDRSYDRKERIVTPNQIRGAYAKNFRAVHVVCLNAAWDEAHPAGSSLDDLARIRHQSYAPYVRSGYKLELPSYAHHLGTPIDKRLSELAEDDLSMLIAYAGHIYFPAPPAASGTYRLQVTFVATDGTQKTGVCEFTWDPASIDPAER